VVAAAGVEVTGPPVAPTYSRELHVLIWPLERVGR